MAQPDKARILIQHSQLKMRSMLVCLQPLTDMARNMKRRPVQASMSAVSSGAKLHKPPSLTSDTVFQVLVCLVSLAFLTSYVLLAQLEANLADTSPLLRRRPQSPSAPPHLHPRLPHLPAFPVIANEEALVNQTLREGRPTVAGIAAVLNRHIRALHASNRRFVAEIGGGEKVGGPKEREEEADAVRAAYFRAVEDTLMPLEEAYRGRPTFEIREDDSIFVSVAAFREHLLAGTLMSAFDGAAHPGRLFLGVIVNNCFGTSDDFPCKGTPEVVGKNKNGIDVVKTVDGRPDINGVETFCQNATYQRYCDAGQVRVLYLDEVDALGPAVARYYCSRLWGGETYFMQVDSHTHFARQWDKLYIEDLKLASSTKPILSTYPGGFLNFRLKPPFKPGTRLCMCQIRKDEEFLPRVELLGTSGEHEARPTQTPFMGAGFIFARAEFLVEVPFDPFMPWIFMGEEVALSIRAWTSGWNIHAPRKSLVGHQYRGLEMGTPHFWDIWAKFFHRPKLMDRLGQTTTDRIKLMMGYPNFTSDGVNHHVPSNYSHTGLDYYGVGKVRSPKEYLKFAQIDLDKLICGKLKWCEKATLE